MTGRQMGPRGRGAAQKFAMSWPGETRRRSSGFRACVKRRWAKLVRAEGKREARA